MDPKSAGAAGRREVVYFVGNRFRKKERNSLPAITSNQRYVTNQAGVTLAEMMVYLGILSILVMLLLPIIHVILKPQEIYTQIRLEREAALFFRQTEIEVNAALQYTIHDGHAPVDVDKLILHMGDDSITYYQQGQKIIRTISSQPRGGHIEMAHFVKEFAVSSITDRLFQISLTMEDNGLEYKIERMMGLKVYYQPEGLDETSVNYD